MSNNETNSISDEEILKLWRNKDFSGSYRGIKTFQILLKTDLNIDISENKLYSILKNDPIFLMHLKPKRKFERRKFDINYYGEVVQSDIAFMFEYDSYKYFLVVIDCFSFKISAKPLQDKSAKTTYKAFKEILSDLNISITKLETDQGSEFTLIKQFCKENHIIYKYKFGKNKAR